MEYASQCEAELARRKVKSESGRKFYELYPDTGPLARSKYEKHLEFFHAGARHNERAFIGGNRTGKSFCMSYEGVCHMTGDYPAWWEGRRFDRPIVCWAAGEDAKAVRESLQPTLMGTSDRRGTGIVPYAAIKKTAMKTGTVDSIDFALIQHKNHGQSRLVFKSYEQGRETFESAQVDVILLDEEPPLSIYSACLTRTISTTPGQPNGLIICAFTPLRGISDTVLTFLPGGAYPATEELRKQAWGW